MSIMLVNDDGIESEGIQTLAKHLKVDHRVIICAPDRNWSFSSGFMSAHKDISARQVKLSGLEDVESWAISGSPADCVSLGLKELASKRPDIVISGINRGENLGVSDLLASGTFNAAACARRMGYPAAAISLARMTDDFASDYTYAGEFSVQIAAALLSGEIPDNMVLNINVPGLERRPSGVKVCKVGGSTHTESYEAIGTATDPVYTQEWMEDGSVQVMEGSDVYWVERGFISVSPVALPQADQSAMHLLERYNFSI